MKPIVAYFRVSTTSRSDPFWGLKRSARRCRGSLKVRGSTSSSSSSRSRPAKEAMRLTGDPNGGGARHGTGTADAGRRIEA